MGRKMTKYDSTNDIFMNTLGKKGIKCKIQRDRPIKKNIFINTIQTISKKERGN